MRVDTDSGWLEAVRRVESPHHDARPAGAHPELIVVHAISLPPGHFGGPWIDALFADRLDPASHEYFAEIAHLKVSAHALVRRTGEVVQYVPFHERAWHAGESCYEGREACNDFSIGIELEGCDEVGFEPIQYRRLVALIQALCAAYPSLSPQRVVGHADIAPGRKTDPGPRFAWQRLHAQLGTAPERRE